MALRISAAVREKLEKKHLVTVREVEQCFDNRDRAGRLILDTRDAHKTDPPSRWFISRTNKNRQLKVIFVQVGGNIFLKSAFEPNAKEIEIYNKLGLGK
jgi:hypothetical protein